MEDAGLFERICGYSVMSMILLLIAAGSFLILTMVFGAICDFLYDLKQHPLFKRDKDPETVDAELIDDHQTCTDRARLKLRS